MSGVRISQSLLNFLFYGTLMVSGLPVKQVYGLKSYGGSSPPCRATWVFSGDGESGLAVTQLPCGLGSSNLSTPIKWYSLSCALEITGGQVTGIT